MTGENDTFAFGFSGIEPALEDFAIRFYREFIAIFDPLLQEAAEFAGFDFFKLFENPSPKPIDPLNNQIFTFVYSLGVDRVLKAHGYKPEMAAGFSLGVYAALCSAEAIAVNDGFRLVKKAYELMYLESKKSACGMSAIVGLSDTDTKEMIRRQKFNSIQKVNTLNDTCRIYSGLAAELMELQKVALEEGAITAVSLGVDIPYHHSVFLAQATKDFRKFLSTIHWQDPVIPVLSSIDQSPLSAKDELLEFTALNLSMPIHWQRVVVKFSELGCTHFVECGPGITLTQNGRFMDIAIKYLNTKNLKNRLGF